MIYYFAYGSNLHPMRLIERVPSAELIGVAKQSDHTLTFHKESHDGSSKCNMHNSGSGLIYGAIYKMNPGHKSELDRFEGKGYGYIDNQITLESNGNEFTCFTYLAMQSYIVNNLKPYHWYKQLVVLGAQYLQFPEAYISSIEAVESIEDPDASRKKEKEELIERINNYC
ncbi:MAG: gamma-glutamylcyclotransferase [Gammaproteobacteria bacterium]|nr:gamma-glutamylcyclotransferase [Gammaproteobacteria bacterium]NNJ49849.1 gamma-glutamylcyclotransferase [Gammaproteobacteria bacterium]